MKKLILLMIFSIVFAGALYAGWLDGLFEKRSSNKKFKTKHTQIAGVRGVDEEGNINYDVRDFDALEKVESLSLSRKEIEDFIKEGGLK